MNSTPQFQVRLYGKNIRFPRSGKSYWSDIESWKTAIKNRTGRLPTKVNVTTKAPEAEAWSRELSPLRMGPVDTYLENGVMKQAVNMEVAWQYSKMYSHNNENGQLQRLDFVGSDGHPNAKWFQWRDAAWGNPHFDWRHPNFENHKLRVRRAFAKGSKVYGWYWDGRVITDPVEARRMIYAGLYCREVMKRTAFHRLQALLKENHVAIYDIDGYDYVALGMTPEDTIRDTTHSWGHGLLLTLLLQGMDPTKLGLEP
jgi:hypothetical protein